jgi:hypothetical protein
LLKRPKVDHRFQHLFPRFDRLLWMRDRSRQGVAPGYEDARKDDQGQSGGNQSSNDYGPLLFRRFQNGVVFNEAGRTRHQVIDIVSIWHGRP